MNPHNTSAAGPEGRLSRDTSAEAERRQVEIWRRMTPLEKARLVSGASKAVQNLSLAGIRRRHPDASEQECLMRLAELKLGRALFRLAYPEAPPLPRSGR